MSSAAAKLDDAHVQHLARLGLLSVSLVALAGCGGLPSWVVARPRATTFDPTGIWYKVGREQFRGGEYQMRMEVEPLRDQWFAMRIAGQTDVDSLLLVDGNHVYAFPAGTALFLSTDGVRGLEGVWGSGEGPVGYARTTAAPGRDYYVGEYAGGRMMTDAWDGGGHHERGLGVIERVGHVGGGQELYRWTLDWGNLGRSVGYGWWSGDHLAIDMGTLTRQTSWIEQRAGSYTETLVTRTTLDPTTVSVGTFEAESADRMWGSVLTTSTSGTGPLYEWIQIMSRTPLTLDDFHAAACAHGSLMDCPDGGAGQPRTVQLASEVANCLTVVDANPESLSPVETMPCAGMPEQTWTITGREIRSALGRCLEVNEASTANGARVQLYDCRGGPNQQWLVDGAFVRSALGTCLDVNAGNPEPGTVVQSWECNATIAQRWSLLTTP